MPDCYVQRVLQEIIGQFLDVRGHGGGEKQRLTPARKALYDPADIRQEAHVEHVIRFNYPAAEARYDRVARALGLPKERAPATTRRERIVGALQDLRRVCGIQDGLAARGVTRGTIVDLAPPVVEDACIFTNPRRPNLADIKTLYAEAL